MNRTLSVSERLFLPVTFGTKVSSYVVGLNLVKSSTLTTFVLLQKYSFQRTGKLFMVSISRLKMI